MIKLFRNMLKAGIGGTMRANLPLSISFVADDTRAADNRKP